MERLTSLLNVLVAAGLGALPAALLTALTSWWNRETAKTQLEAERLRRQKDDDAGGIS